MYVCPCVFVLALCIFHNERDTEREAERKMEKEGLACMMTQITETG